MNARESAYIESEINADICYSMDRKKAEGKGNEAGKTDQNRRLGF